jgi:UDP-glucose 4-epimerase
VPRIGGQVFNVACGERYTLLELIARLNGILGTEIEPTFGPPRPGDVKHSLADIGRAERELGYRVETSFEEGLEQTVAWYRQQAR